MEGHLSQFVDKITIKSLGNGKEQFWKLYTERWNSFTCAVSPTEKQIHTETQSPGSMPKFILNTRIYSCINRPTMFYHVYASFVYCKALIMSVYNYLSVWLQIYPHTCVHSHWSQLDHQCCAQSINENLSSLRILNTNY